MTTPDPADFRFDLPEDLIAQQPTAERDGARLLVLPRAPKGDDAPSHGQVLDLPKWLRDGDLLVVNETRVLPARLRGHKESGGRAEALLLGPAPDGESRYRALVRIGGRLRPGIVLHFEAAPHAGGARPPLRAEIAAVARDGEVTLAFAPGADPYALGETPLPPYIARAEPRRDDAERYQTTFARVPGSVAAPTAGLHLSERLLARIDAVGVERATVVLHVGPGTFRPPRPEDLAAGRLHAEPYELPEETAAAIARTRRRGGRVIAVGTTSTRVLETCATDDGHVTPGHGETRLLLAPGSRFRVVDGLLTNFHLPESSLLMLVAAFAGRERVLAAYREAVGLGYRFYSYGDAMFLA